MKTVWLIWSVEEAGWLWKMYEQDGHLAVFSSFEKAEEFVKNHPWLIDGEMHYLEFPVDS